MKRQTSRILLTSFILLSALQFSASKDNNVEATVGYTTKPHWLGADPSAIQGQAPAQQLLPEHPDYSYYKRIVGKNREPLIFHSTYAGGHTFYTPVADGGNAQYSDIFKPEQLFINNKSTTPTDWRSWTHNKNYQASDHLIDKSKSPHAKKTQNDLAVLNKNKGYLKVAVKPSANLIETGMFKGHKGEWRQLGYSESGGVILNGLFPPEHYSKDEYFSKQGYNMAYYPSQVKPWEQKDSAAYVRVNGGTKFDTATTRVRSADYHIKHKAMTRFLDERPNYKARSSSVQFWMDRHSLQNDPSDGGAAYFIASQPSGFYYHATASALPHSQKNLTLTRQRVLDSKGRVIRTFTRKAGETNGTLSKQSRTLVSGEKVTIETTIRNTSPQGNNTTTLMNPKVNLGYKTGSSALNKDTYLKADSMDKTFSVSAKNKLAQGKEVNLKETFEVPFNSTTMAVYGEVDRMHYYTRDNTNTRDDFAQLSLAVDNEAGNFQNANIKLIGKDGKVVSKPVPGHEYKMTFGFKYVAKQNARNNVTVKIDYQITRRLPFNGKDTQKSSVQMKNFKPEAGKTYSLTTPDFITYETGVFDVESILSIIGNQNYNQNTNDDKQKTAFNDAYDLSVRNVQLIPNDISHTDKGKMTYLVKADVDYNVPTHVKDHAKDVAFTVNVGGTEKTVKRHIRQGFNPNVTIEVDVPSNGKSRVVNATMLVNSDNYVYESITNNNRGTASAKVENEARIRPYSGSVVNKTDWKQHVEIREWTSQNRTYKGFNNGKSFSFPLYKSAGAPRKSTVDLTESYRIDHVWFKSKTTTDMKEGPKRDGWVDLMKEPGKIKAGYGYELKVDVSYETDAFTKVAKETSTRSVRPGIAKPSLPNNLYIQTPDNVIHSVNGDGGSIQSLTHKRRNVSDNKTTWEFEIAPRRTLGVDTLGKFFIGEDVANGTYDMTVFTPKTSGLLGKMTSETSVLNRALFDQKSNLRIEVIGSATDDITDHITQ